MSTKIQQLAVASLAAISLITVAVLSIISHPVPSGLWNVTYILIGATAGVTVPSVVTAVAPKTDVA
jgi:hypothetical protein